MWIRQKTSLSEKALVGERVALEFLSSEDAEELLYLVDSSRESLERWLPWVEKFTRAVDAESFIESYRLQLDMGNGGIWGVRRRCDGALVGTVCLQWIDWSNLAANFGYFLGKEFEGNGFATESLHLVLDFVKGLGIHRVGISAAVENERSSALALRLGFSFEGISKEAEFLHGKWRDVNRYAKIF